MKFTELNMRENLLKAITEVGYETLTPIQEKTYQEVLNGRDILGLAKTGSGKTGACAIPLLQKIDLESREIQALVVVPTRELALQYTSEIEKFSKYLEVEALAVYGGVPIVEQQSVLRQGVQILVATPGRLIDHIYSSKISFKHLSTFILDEADEMLNMGFFEDIQFIMSCIMNKHQTLLFSATMPKEISNLAHECLTDPITVELKKEEMVPANITHLFKKITHRDRVKHAVNYLREIEYKQVIVFCNSRRNVESVCGELKRKFKYVEYIHGGMPQEKRTYIFDKVKNNRIRILLATDVAGRGLDFSNVTHVINYDFPNDPESFTHRTGRTGRMGRKGESMSFVTTRDEQVFKDTLKLTGIEPTFHEDKPENQKSTEEKSSDRSNDYKSTRGKSSNKKYHKPEHKQNDSSEKQSQNRNQKNKPKPNSNSSRDKQQNKRSQNNHNNQNRNNHRDKKSYDKGSQHRSDETNHRNTYVAPKKGAADRLFDFVKSMWDKLFW
ncbi:MAG: DEAD/DEAH box helicase [Candidatus Cloacimonetes bacterium]|nr:DEAD/DEAH box helicase [Candidatus Cloacimonadota bacterium]